MSQVTVFSKASPVGLATISEEDRLIAGWLTVEVVDRQGELVPVEDLKPALIKFMDRGAPLLYGHSNKPVGKILYWEERIHPDTGKPGIYVIAKIFKDYSIDDVVWELIKQGKITGFSISGRASREVVQGSEGTYVVRKDLELLEVSLVDTPANPHAVIDEINVLAKGDNCESRYMEDERHFKLMTCPGSETGKKWRYCGCVRYMICRGYSTEEAEAICAKIKRGEEDEARTKEEASKSEGMVDMDTGGIHNETYGGDMGNCMDEQGKAKACHENIKTEDNKNIDVGKAMSYPPKEGEVNVQAKHENDQGLEEKQMSLQAESPKSGTTALIKEDDGCKKRYLVEEPGGGSHFKEMTCPDNPDNSSRFCGCVRYFMSCQNKSLDSAKRICAYIKRMKYGKGETMSMEELEALVKDLITIVIDPMGDEDVKVETENNNKEESGDSQDGQAMEERIQALEKSVEQIAKVVGELAQVVSKLAETQTQVQKKADEVEKGETTQVKEEVEKSQPQAQTPLPGAPTMVRPGIQPSADLVKHIENILQGKNVHQEIKYIIQEMIRKGGGLA